MMLLLPRRDALLCLALRGFGMLRPDSDIHMHTGGAGNMRVALGVGAADAAKVVEEVALTRVGRH